MPARRAGAVPRALQGEIVSSTPHIADMKEASLRRFCHRRIARAPPPKGADNPDAARWEQQAQNVTITRDDWGIAHIHGKTDADAVFGLVYAQAEDDFNRVETNYINSMGRLAEAEGESGDLPRPAHEAVHRSRQHEGEVRGEPRLGSSRSWMRGPMG